MKALRVHDIDFAHQDVGRDLVFGAAELAAPICPVYGRHSNSGFVILEAGCGSVNAA